MTWDSDALKQYIDSMAAERLAALNRVENEAAARTRLLEERVAALSKIVWVGIGLAIAVSVFLPLMLAR